MQYGLNRVLEPKHVLPTSAWKLDNSRNIEDNEIRVSLTRIHLEGTSFKQICTESNNNEEKIKRTIIDIVIRRGKLHNPVTDTGGMILGKVEAIGENYNNPRGLKVGDEVICNASSTSIPIYIEDIKGLNFVFNQIEATGYAILSDEISIVKVEEGLPVDLLMFVLDESGTLYKLSEMVVDQQKFLIVGNNIITNLLFGYAIRRKVGSDCEIICLLDKKTDIQITDGGIDKLIAEVFNQVHFLDILKPMECLAKLGLESLFDLSVNCAEIPGAETINILATKEGGTVLFANLINNLKIALYITESISKSLNVKSAEGYIAGYADFDIEIVRELGGYFEGARMAKAEKLMLSEERENPYSKTVLENTMTEDFVFKSRAMRQVLEEIMKVSKFDCNVIIFGETGVGKEKVANLIQKNSDRKMQNFIKINCGAISPNLIESEFFGYEKGAFTGASNTGKKGYFEVANDGIMFLDEIGELPLEMQAKLLRVIQDGEFYRVGGTQPIKTNVRIFSATNRDLEKLVEEGRFRRDLYYRLNVYAIKIPSLADRPEDVEPLTHHFLSKYAKKFNISRGITDSAIEYLEQLKWQGNIRELENSVQRLMISARGEDITLMDVVNELNGDVFNEVSFEREERGIGSIKDVKTELHLMQAVGEYEKGLIKYACEKYGSTRKAAKAIGISQTQLVRKKKKYGIDTEEIDEPI